MAAASSLLLPPTSLLPSPLKSPPPHLISSSLPPLPPHKQPSPSPAPSSSSLSRRTATLSLAGLSALLALSQPLPALADIEDDYKLETEKVILQVRTTLGLEKTDPSRGDAVKALRQTSNDWVAKYRREKRFAGKPSYGNMYSVLNAVSGHYISYGDGSVIPTKRKTLILEELDQAERALNRGR